MHSLSHRRLLWAVLFCLLLLILYGECKRNSRNKKGRKNSNETLTQENSQAKHHRPKPKGHKKSRRKITAETSEKEVSQTSENVILFTTTESSGNGSSYAPTPSFKDRTSTTVLPQTTKANTEVFTLQTSAISRGMQRDKSKEKNRRKHNSQVVKTSLGKVRGKKEKVFPDKEIKIFLGIQYGEAPIGAKRFQHPSPAASWKGVRDAREYPCTCFQWRDQSFEHYEKGFRGTAMWNANTKLSEDCLYLNVWTPSEKSNLPVMVWIYGGGYYSGTSSLDVYNGKWLAATQDVVVVSMNYRIGALGFLAAGDEEFPGNSGLLDQRLALQWVRDNIEAFGGDPSQVTLFGESAGAASVALHILSKGSAKLFRNVILQSSSSSSPWTILDKKEARRRAIKLAHKFNCTLLGKEKRKESFEKCNGPSTEVTVNASCLRAIPPQDLLDQEIYLEDLGTARFPNAPVVDGKFIESFPSVSEGSQYFNEDVNILAGYNENEGNYFLVYGSDGFELKNGSKIDYLNFTAGVRRAMRSLDGFECADEKVKDILVSASSFKYTQGLWSSPASLRDERVSNDKSKKEILKSLQEDYETDSDVFYRDRLDDLTGDLNFVCPTIGFIDDVLKREMTAKTKENPSRKLFLYHFVHRSSKNPWPEWMGVMHGYEIEFVFGLPLDETLNYTEKERNLSLSMMNYWGNFAKYGDPNGNMENQWPLYNNATKYIYRLGGETTPAIKSLMFSQTYWNQQSRCTFWNDYLPNFRKSIDHLLERPSTTCGSVASPAGGAASSIKASSTLLGLLSFLVFVVN